MPEKKEKTKVEKIPCTWPGCIKLVDPRGMPPHLQAHERQALAVKEQAAKTPFSKSKLQREEAADNKELEQTQKFVQDKQEKGETFDQQEVDEIKENVSTLKSRKLMRNKVAMSDLDAINEENLKRQRDAKKDMEDNDAPSWKEVDKDARRKRMYGGQDNSMAQFFQMQMQMQQNNQEQNNKAHEREMKIQDQIHQVQVENNKQNFEFMKLQLADAKKEKDPMEKLKEFKNWGKSEGYTKEGDSTAATIINAGLPALTDMFRDYISLKQQQQQGYFNPPQQNPDQPIPAQQQQQPLHMQPPDGPNVMPEQAPAPDQSEIEMSNTMGAQVNPNIAPGAEAPAEPTDAQLMAMPQLHDPSRPNVEFEENLFNQYLNTGAYQKFAPAPTSTAPSI